MTITIEPTWHLILMVILWIFLIYKMFADDEMTGNDFQILFYGILIFLSVAVYGGLVWW